MNSVGTITPDSKPQILMKLVSVYRMLKELQDTLFVSKLFSTGTVVSKIHFAIS